MKPTPRHGVRARHSLLALLVLALATSCFQLRYQRDSRFEPVDELAAAALEPGVADLTQCLATFGAPLWVWEVYTPDGPGAALAYGWFDSTNWGAQVSAPVTDYVQASLDYDDVDARMRGLVLFFGPEWRLREQRLGNLRDLTVELSRRRPLPLEDL